MSADQLNRPPLVPDGNDFDLKNLTANRKPAETDPEEARLRALRLAEATAPKDYNLKNLEAYRRYTSGLDSDIDATQGEDDEIPSEIGFGQDADDSIEETTAPQSQSFDGIRSSQTDNITDRALERAKQRYSDKASRGVPGADQPPQLANGKTGQNLSATSPHKNITATKGKPWTPPGAASTTKGVQKAGQQVGKATAKAAASTGVKVAGKVGAKAAIGAAAGAATGGIATAAQIAFEAGSALFHKLNSAKNKQRMFYGIIFLFFVAIFIFSTFIPANKARVDQNGPNADGGTRTRPESDSYASAIGGQQPGIIMANSIEAMQIAVKQIKVLLDTKPPKGANVAEAKRVLSEIDALQDDLKTASHLSDKTARADITGRFRTLVNDLFKAVYPGRTALQAQVLALVNDTKGGRITTQSGGCAAKRDLTNFAVHENTLKLIIAAANFKPVTINCLVSGHRKYVGRPPSQGYPRCGEPRAVSGASVSRHCLGLAVDFDDTTSGLYEFLQKNKSALNIRLLLNEGDHIHVELNQTESNS